METCSPTVCFLPVLLKISRLARPVIHTNESRKFEVSEYDPTLVEGDEFKASEGVTAEIPCPVVGYPIPNVVWYKDGLPLGMLPWSF